MTKREEEIAYACYKWCEKFEYAEPEEAYQAGAEYADEHPSEETIQKVIESAKDWLNEQSCCGWIEDVEVDEFIEKFEKEIKERIGIKEE